MKQKIAIHSVPRSGSSWLGQIFNSSKQVSYRFQPLFSYAFKDFLDENSDKDKIDVFFKNISASDDEFLTQQENILSNRYPSFIKNDDSEFIAYKEVRYHNILRNMFNTDDSIIGFGLIRNPYATIDSFLRSPREFRKDLDWQEIKEWEFAQSKNNNKPEEYFGFDKWCETVDIFEDLERRYPLRFRIIHYSDLLSNECDKIVQTLFKFAGLEYENQTSDFIINRSNIKNNMVDTYSVYRDKFDDYQWKITLNSKIIEQIYDRIKGTKYEKYNY